MGFTSQDDLIAQLTAGKSLRREAHKSTSPVHTASGWHLLVGLNGYPNAGTFPGTDLLWAACDENSGDGTTIIGMQHGGPPGGSATKHILNVGAQMVAAAGAPWQAKLVDLMGYYRMSTTNVTGTGSRSLSGVSVQTFTASNSGGNLLITYANDFKTLTKVRVSTTTTLPTGLAAATDYWLVRQSSTTALVSTSYANALAGTYVAYTDGGTGTHTATPRVSRTMTGCEAFFVSQTAPTAGGPTLSASSYTNSDGTAGRAFQGTPTMNAAADSYACRVLHSGAAANRYGAFLPKQGADKGIQSIESFTWSAGTAYTGSGVVALCIVRPILDLILPATGVWSERDLVNQLPSLPKVDDGACLAWMLFGTGATTTGSPFVSAIDFGWGG